MQAMSMKAVMLHIQATVKMKKRPWRQKIGHWYSVTKNKAAKAWVYAQALMWACEEGETSEKNLLT